MKTKLIEIPDQEYVYYIVDNHSKWATVMIKPLYWLELYKIIDLNKYGYYLTPEEAEKHLYKNKIK